MVRALRTLYVDTAVRRWQALTGEAARHAASGRAFDEMAEERAAAPAPQEVSRGT